MRARRKALLLLLLGAVGCSWKRGDEPAAAADDAAPVAEVSLPPPSAAVGEAATWQRDTTLTTRGRMYHKGKFRGNVSWVGSRRSTIRAETLAVDGGNPSRLRLTYVAHASATTVGGVTRAIGPALEGKSFLVDLAGGDVRVATGDGAPAAPAEEERVRLDVHDLDLAWRPLLGRRLKIGESIAGGALLLKAVRGDALVVELHQRGNIGAGLGASIEAPINYDAVIDRRTGRLRELRDEGAGSLSGASIDGDRNAQLAGSAELVGSARVVPASPG